MCVCVQAMEKAAAKGAGIHLHRQAPDARSKHRSPQVFGGDGTKDRSSPVRLMRQRVQFGEAWFNTDALLFLAKAGESEGSTHPGWVSASTIL